MYYICIYIILYVCSGMWECMRACMRMCVCMKVSLTHKQNVHFKLIPEVLFKENCAFCYIKIYIL